MNTITLTDQQLYILSLAIASLHMEILKNRHLYQQEYLDAVLETHGIVTNAI